MSHSHLVNAARSESAGRTGFGTRLPLPPAGTPAFAVDVVALGVVLAAVTDAHAPASEGALGTSFRTEEPGEPWLAVPATGDVIAAGKKE